MAFAIAGGKAEQENSGQGEGPSAPARMQWTGLFHDLCKVTLSEIKLSEINVNELTWACGFAARFIFLL
jgi:hypothetical protein